MLILSDEYHTVTSSTLIERKRLRKTSRLVGSSVFLERLTWNTWSKLSNVNSTNICFISERQVSGPTKLTKFFHFIVYQFVCYLFVA